MIIILKSDFLLNKKVKTNFLLFIKKILIYLISYFISFIKVNNKKYL